MERVQAPPGLRGDALEFEAIKMQIKAILAAPTLGNPSWPVRGLLGWVSITINPFGIWDRKEAGRINTPQGDLNFKTSLGVEFTARPGQQMASKSLTFESREGHA